MHILCCCVNFEKQGLSTRPVSRATRSYNIKHQKNYIKITKWVKKLLKMGVKFNEIGGYSSKNNSKKLQRVIAKALKTVKT